MSAPPVLSILVPTRNRPAQLQTLLTSLAETTAEPACLEVVLIIDADDSQSQQIHHPSLMIRRIVVPPGLSMGSLNMAGYEAAAGRYLMLLNDDVICRTKGWDSAIAACFSCAPDDILLVHVNDTLMQTALCTFPVVSRTVCELAGGICPREYLRYRIDDHIEDIFNLLAYLGECRTIYLPEVIFEHGNYVETAPGLRQYFSEPATLARDAPTFEAYLPQRKELALQLCRCIDANRFDAAEVSWRAQLAFVTDSFALRVPGRLRILTDFTPANLRRLRARIASRQPEPQPSSNSWLTLLRKARACLQSSKYRGLARAIWHKLRRVVGYS